MKLICLLLLIASSALAALILDPFPLTGSGSYTHGISADNVSSIDASGAASGHTISFSLTYFPVYNPGEFFFYRGNGLAPGQHFTPTIFLDSGYYTNFFIRFNNGGGLVEIYDSFNQLSIQAPLIGYTSTRSFTSDIYGYQGSYGIVPAPEPATFALAAVTLGLLAWRRANAKL